MRWHGLFALIAVFATLPACGGDGHNRVNGGVTVHTGETAQDASTVNGGIHISADGSARDVDTVNGSIRLDEGAKARSLDTVNGGITLGEGAEVAKNAETVNGSISLARTAKVSGSASGVNAGISLAEGAEVAGRVENVNGSIRLTDAHVGGGISTVSGDIEVGANSRVEGGISVHKSHGVSIGWRNVPRIVIGPGAVVKGTLRFERKVRLYVSDSATIGAVEGAKAEMFSGEQPAG